MRVNRSRSTGWAYAVFLFLFPVTSLWASVQPAIGEQQLINEVLDRSGVSAQINAIPALVKSQLEQYQSHATPDRNKYPQLLNQLNASFNPENVRNAMLRQLIINYNQDYFRSYLVGLEDPAIQRLTQMEIAAATDPDSGRKMAQYLTQLEYNPPSSKRKALIRALDESSNSSRFVAATQATIYRVVTETMNYSSRPPHRLSLEKIDDNADALMQQRLTAASEYVMNNALFVYRNVSDDDLQAYVNFHHSEAATWFHQLLQQAWIGSIRDIGRDIAWHLEQQNTQVTTVDDDFLN